MDASLSLTPDVLGQVYQTHDPDLAGHQQAEAVVSGAFGITVLCSANPRGEGEHAWLIQLEEDGSVGWERHYASGLGTGRAIAALPVGGFVIAGDVQRGGMEYQAQLLRVATDGSVIAHDAFGSRGASGFRTVTLLNDGSTLAGGTARWKGWLLSADDELRVNWDMTLEDVDGVEGLAPIDGGFAMVAIQEKSTTALGMTLLAAYAANQNVRYQERLPTAGRGELAALTTLPDGDLVAVGQHSASGRDVARLWVVRVDTAGEVAWERFLGTADEDHRGRAVVQTADGGLAVVGDAQRDGRRSLRVIHLTIDGTVAWERAYGGEHEYAVARGIARTENDGVVVVGSTTAKGRDKTTALILRLDSEGRLLWDRVFDSTG